MSIPDEELENYFSAPLTYPPTESSFPIHHHLVIIKEELQKWLPLDPATLDKLERSLLKVAESGDAEVLVSLWQAYTDILPTLSKVVLDH